MNYSGNRNEVLALAEVPQPPNNTIPAVDNINYPQSCLCTDAILNYLPFSLLKNK